MVSSDEHSIQHLARQTSDPLPQHVLLLHWPQNFKDDCVLLVMATLSTMFSKSKISECKEQSNTSEEDRSSLEVPCRQDRSQVFISETGRNLKK